MLHQQTAPKSTLDLNVILRWANWLFFAATLFFYLKNGGNEYVDGRSVVLGGLLSLQMHLFLYLEYRRRDPFVLLLCLQMVFYFVLRLASLAFYPFSNVFLRYPFGPDQLNYGLVFILVANCVLYAGLSFNRIAPEPPQFRLRHVYQPRQTHLVVLMLAIGFVMAFAPALGIVGLSTLIGMLNSLFINLSILLFMVLVYVVLFNKHISRTMAIVLFAGILLFVLLQTLTGSRSAILTLLNYLLFGFLGIYGFVRLKVRYLLTFVLLLPLMIGFFLVATFLRPRLEDRSMLSKETFETIKDFKVEGSVDESAAFLLAPVFDRIGFLDFTAETIANGEHYQSVFNLPYYGKSIVDNVLTPGFDVFGVPRVSNATTFIYNNYGKPEKAKVVEAYQSDEFTLYGELYVLLGKWFALIPIFLVGFFAKRIYVNLKDANPFQFLLKRGFVLAIYYSLLNSFGLDWVVLDLVGLLFTYAIFKRFFRFGVAAEASPA